MSFFEFVFRARGFDLTEASRELAALDALSWAELERWNHARRDEIARYHAANNPLYQARVGSVYPDAWHRLPIMSKRDYQGALDAVITPALAGEPLYRSSTSGSSGTPLMFAKDRVAHARTWAVIKRHYASHGLTLDSKQARFFGTPLEGRSKWQEAFKDFTMNRKRFVVFDLSDARLASFEETFRRTPFEYVYGFTSSIAVFARYLLRHGRTLRAVCPTLKLCMVTSEVCAPEDRQVIAEGLGVPVVNEYGASEVGIIAFDTPAGDWAVSDETLFVEAVDERGDPVPDGTVGRLLVTDLHNRAWPCVRYEIGDMGALRSPADPHTRARRVLERLEGRVGDNIVLPSGRKTAAFTFYYVTRSLLETWDVFRELQIRQTAPDAFEFDIVSEGLLTPEQETEILRLVDKYFEPGLRVRINRVPNIPGSASGKRRHFQPFRPDAGVASAPPR